MIEPLVSIGVPTYNRPLGLRHTLERILSQTYGNMEIIVSDNCSPDQRVEAIAKEFTEKDRRFQYFRQKENIGMVMNSQFLLDNAHGDFFMWMADDDWLEEDVYIEKCALFLRDHPDYVMATGRTKFYNKNMKFIYRAEMMSLSYDNKFDRLKEYFSKVNFESLCYSLVRINALKKVKPGNGYANDWSLVAELLYFGKAQIIDGVKIGKSIAGATENFGTYRKALNRPELNIFNYWSYLVSEVLDSLREFESSLPSVKPLSEQEFAVLRKILERKGALYRRVLTRLRRLIVIKLRESGLLV